MNDCLKVHGTLFFSSSFYSLLSSNPPPSLLSYGLTRNCSLKLHASIREREQMYNICSLSFFTIQETYLQHSYIYICIEAHEINIKFYDAKRWQSKKLNPDWGMKNYFYMQQSSAQLLERLFTQSSGERESALEPVYNRFKCASNHVITMHQGMCSHDTTRYTCIANKVLGAEEERERREIRNEKSLLNGVWKRGSVGRRGRRLVAGRG